MSSHFHSLWRWYLYILADSFRISKTPEITLLLLQRHLEPILVHCFPFGHNLDRQQFILDRPSISDTRYIIMRVISKIVEVLVLVIRNICS
jgi:hypothetical protein